MEQIKTTEFALGEIEQHPEIITDFFRKNKRVCLILQKDEESNTIHIGIRKVYSKQVTELLEGVYKKYTEKKKKGYSREQAIQDFLDAQKEISKYLSKR